MTKDELDSLLIYDDKNGKLYWKVDGNSGRNKRIGNEAGSLHKQLGYIYVSIDNKSYLAHRLIYCMMVGDFPKHHIDHINGIRNDNRWVNLRDVDICTNTQNQRKPSKNNSTGFLGVTKNGSGYSAAIGHNGKYTYLGTFKTPEKAYEVYLAAKRKFHQGNTL